MTNKLLSAALAAALAVAAPAIALAQAAPAAAAAQQGSASKVVLDNSTRILTTLEQRRAEFKNNNAALKKFIDSEMDTSFDRDYAARLVLGVHGRGASDADVKLFADAMADNLMQRYGTSLLTFEGKPQVRVKSETPLPGGRGAKVSTELLRSGGDPIPVDYLLRNSGGSWKIFDVMVEGVSYVQTFRNQFDTPLRTKSIPQVAADLRNGAMQVAPASTSGK
ncbi:MlaC/ttg2D family ABC transporter substrate-binding protein [Xanthomonas graminis]|uniref:Organic solvent ABC transporter n=1 Tax=Xanthomonas graminis pv. poae TaxID=227946 RepID=A0A199NWV0_9XANT|nr:ABC transporter substrate-binding protein [Xanthomonas translucens]OAX53422.1 organic solvent ABC transporter [Xanthomonas translucens pv. poae]